MTHSRSRFVWCALLLVVGLAAPAIAQPTPMLCNVIANNPLLRQEGYTETVGDLFVACTGGVPTAPGSVVPAANFTVFFSNTRITSKVTAATASNAVLFNESLLLVDEPNTSSALQHPILNCGQTGAPDDGPAGPGVCSIISSGDPAATYDGSPGHPNVFQGQVADSVYFNVRGSAGGSTGNRQPPIFPHHQPSRQRRGIYGLLYDNPLLDRDNGER